MGAILGPLIAIIIGIFMVVLDSTAVNVALPKLVTDFHSTLSTLQWTITGYALAQAAVIPLAGCLTALEPSGSSWPRWPCLQWARCCAPPLGTARC